MPILIEIQNLKKKKKKLESQKAKKLKLGRKDCDFNQG